MSRMWEYQKFWGLRFTDTFLQLFCEKNSDGTKKLRFKANELEQRFSDQLVPADMVYVCTFLNAHPEVNEVDLSYNDIENEGIETLCHITLSHENSLEHLNLTHCHITAAGMKTFYLTAEKHGYLKLKTLRLTGNKLGPTGGHMTALMLPYCPTMEYLDLGDTDQSADSIDCIFLQVYRSNIKILNISRAIPIQNLALVNADFLAESISELFRVNQTIVELHAQKCGLDAHNVETLIEGLKLNSSLRFLDIGYNNICCVGVEFLSDWLKGRPNLLGLCIAGNNIKDHGGVALSFGMPFSKLRYLDISYNHIANEGIIAILHSIKKPYMLRYFLLWGNHFTHPALKILQRMMKSTVFEQRGIDVKIYCVDDVLYAARYPVDKYKHRYYNVMDYGCAVELKIKRNRIETPEDKPRALVNFVHIDRYPPVEIPPKVKKPVEQQKEEDVRKTSQGESDLRKSIQGEGDSRKLSQGEASLTSQGEKQSRKSSQGEEVQKKSIQVEQNVRKSSQGEASLTSRGEGQPRKSSQGEEVPKKLIQIEENVRKSSQGEEVPKKSIQIEQNVRTSGQREASLRSQGEGQLRKSSQGEEVPKKSILIDQNVRKSSQGEASLMSQGEGQLRKSSQGEEVLRKPIQVEENIRKSTQGKGLLKKSIQIEELKESGQGEGLLKKQNEEESEEARQ